MAIHKNSEQNRDQQPSRLPSTGEASLLFEAVRSGAPGCPPRQGDKEGDRPSPLWRIFGGTLLSIAALVIITLTQQFTSILTEVRQDLNRMHESRGELARKEEVATAVKDFQAEASGLAALRERSLYLEQQVKEGEAERKQQARELRELRERLAEAVGRQSAFSAADGRGGARASK